MRSFIKSHRRNESINSEGHDNPESLDYFARTTPANSPSLQQSSQLTPPQAITGSSNGSISSPKKLLTPIKNLFSSSSKNLTLNSGDNLNNAIYNSSKSGSSKLKLKNHKRASHSISNISDLLIDTSLKSTSSHLSSNSQPVSASGTVPNSVFNDPKFDLASKLPSNQQPSLAPPPNLVSSSYAPTLNHPSHLQQQHSYPHSNSSTSLSSIVRSNKTYSSPVSVSHSSYSLSQLSSRKEPFNEISHTPPELIAHNPTPDKPQCNDKQVSFAANSNSIPTLEYGKNSSVKSNLKSPLDLRKTDNNSDNEDNDTIDGEEDEDEESDSSSQFSFVKDKIGGRNTSVKYYKAAKSTPPSTNEGISNTFNEHDLGYEVDEYSDYDYDNNGMDDDYDFDDENQGDEQYNKLFDDDLEHVNNINDDIESSKQNESDNVDDEYNDLEEEVPSRIDGIDDIDDVPSGVKGFETPPLKGGAFYNGDPHSQVDDYEEGYYHNHISTIEELTEIVDPEDVPSIERSVDTDNLLRLPNHSLPKQFNKAFHLSIQGLPSTPPTLSSKSFESVDESEINTDDILENYLEFSKLPSVTHAHSTSSLDAATDMANGDYLHLYDLSSPIINGLTFGNNLHHRYPRRDNSKNSGTDHFSRNLDSDKNGKFYNLPSNSNIKSYSSERQERDVFKERILRSFHGSLSDDLNFTIPEKVLAMEEFSKMLRANATASPSPVVNPSPQNLEVPDSSPEATKLKSVDKESNSSKMDKATTRLSIIEMMDLLGSLETSDTTTNLLGLKDSNNENENKRQSISNMMNFLSSIETSQNGEDSKPPAAMNKETREQNRRSIADMMSTLSILESNTSDSTTEAKAKRKSITNMMNLLSKLDQENEKYEYKEEPKQKAISKNPIARLNTEKSDPRKRYSWFNNDEMINFKSKNAQIVDNLLKSASANNVVTNLTDEELNDEGTNFQVDQELLDEVNQLPEDFDFEEHELKSKFQKPMIELGFYRSNSYNKKPIRAMMDNHYLSNKIETLNKTVTFYRSNSVGNTPELSKSRSISRAPSSRSMMSFASLNEEDSSEEQEYPQVDTVPHDTLNVPFHFKPSHHSLEESSDSSGKPLNTITETSPSK